jgi:cobalt-zinc-cadmium efflux system outer membrane protein
MVVRPFLQAARNSAPLVLGLTMGWNSLPALAQAPDTGRQSGGVLLEFPNFGPIPGSTEPSLGPGPGALQPSTMAPESGLIGGRRRAGRIPRTKGNQITPAAALAQPPSMRLPAALPEHEAATRSPSETVSSVIEDEGPADGLTLDAAIQRMLDANLDVLALKYEIPQADADILTAGLRTNPLIYFDDQFIPYGAFTSARPGGPTQYDINITYPIDVTHKRQARVRVARSAKSVLEAQFQDVIRRQIGNLCRAFVDLQSARISYLTAAASVREQERVVAAARRRAGQDETDAEQTAERLSIALDKARGSLSDARDTLADAQEAMAVLLSSPPEETSRLQPRGTLRDTGPPPPPLDELTRVALEHRPDVVAARRGIGRAQAELALQRANRLDDVFLFYDPLTYQDNSPSKLKSGRSWVVAVTLPLPIYNRNQGNIARAHSNLHQTQVELAALERRVVSEVRLAEREYRNSRDALDRIEKTTLPHAGKVLQRNTRDFEAGKITPDDYLEHLSDEAEAAGSFRDALIRHRRSMIDVNTAVGLRVLP